MMRRSYEAFVSSLNALPDYERHDFLMACVRSLLQTVVLCLVDTLAERNEEDDLIQELVRDPDRIFTNDSAPVELIDKLLTKLRVARDEMICPSWKKERMESWASYRNTICHGVPGRPLIQKAIPDLERLVAQLLEIFEPVLPEKGRKNRLGAEIRSLPREYGGTPVVFRQSTRIFPLEVESTSKRFEFQATSVLGARSTNNISCKRYTLDGKECRVRLPEKPEFFLFRKGPLERLSEWWREINGNNVVLIQADGGMGKTTLLLEFLYRSIQEAEEISDFSPPPDLANPPAVYIPRILCFSTAKLTMFGFEGVQPRTPDAPTLDMVARNLWGMLGAQFPENLSGLDLWTCLRDELTRRNIAPRDVVVAIDNAETMTEDMKENPTEAADIFGKNIGRIARLGFRVLVTSRRHERFDHGMTPIDLDNFEKEESLQFVKCRAEQLATSPSSRGRLQAILSGVAALHDALSMLRGIPLLLDVFVRRIAQSGAGLVDTARHLATEDTSDLCNFLYEPAWNTTEDSCKKSLLVLQKIGPCAVQITKRIPSHFGVPYEYFRRTMQQADFFDGKSLKNEMGDTILKPWAARFLQGKLENCSSEEKEEIENVYNQLQKELSFNDVSLTNEVKKAISSWEIGDLHSAEAHFKKAWLQEPENEKLALKYGEFLIDVGDIPGDLRRILELSLDGTLLLAKSCIPRQRDRNFDRYVEKSEQMGAHRDELALLKASYFIESLRILSSQPPVLRQQLSEAEDVWQDYNQEMGELRRKIQDHLDRVTPLPSDPTPQDTAREERRLELENRLRDLSDPAG